MQTASDPCLYITSEGEIFIIAVYVDDIVLAGKSNKRMAEVKKALAMQFEVKDMGELHYFLGIKVVQKTGEVWISQPAYAESVPQKFGMENAKPVNTPVDASMTLVKTTEDLDSVDQGLYQSPVGSFLYLSVVTRPDITYAVSNVAKKQHSQTYQTVSERYIEAWSTLQQRWLERLHWIFRC